MADLSRGLAVRGHDVHLIYSPLRMDEPFTRFLSASEGIATWELPIVREPSPQDVKTIALLRKYIRKHGPFDVLHGHSSKAGALVRLLGKPQGARQEVKVYTPHGFVTMNPRLAPRKRRLYSQVERILSRFSDRIIAVSEEEYRHAIEQGIDESKLSVIPNGIPPLIFPARTKIRESLGLRDSDVCIGFVGRLVSEKAPEVLIQAFYLLRGKGYSNVRLAIVGGGELEFEVRRQAEELGVGAHILWLGQREARDVLPAFDIFVLPSRCEAFPYVLLEAMAAGLPIVSTDVGGARAVISPGINGFIVQPDDPAHLAANLLDLVRSPELRTRMGTQSAQLVTQYSADEMVKRTLELYIELVKTKREINRLRGTE